MNSALLLVIIFVVVLGIIALVVGVILVLTSRKEEIRIPEPIPPAPGYCTVKGDCLKEENCLNNVCTPIEDIVPFANMERQFQRLETLILETRREPTILIENKIDPLPKDYSAQQTNSPKQETSRQTIKQTNSPKQETSRQTIKQTNSPKQETIFNLQPEYENYSLPSSTPNLLSNITERKDNPSPSLPSEEDYYRQFSRTSCLDNRKQGEIIPVGERIKEASVRTLQETARKGKRVQGWAI